jgi:aminopeptidase N
MYYKGGNLVHFVRQLFNDDEKFRMALREMNQRFYHKITTSAEVEKFWSEKVGRDLTPLFNQYLRETQVPTLEFKREGNKLKYRWSDCLSNFNSPVRIELNNQMMWIYPTTSWKEYKSKNKIESINIDKNFYVGFTELF